MYRRERSSGFTLVELMMTLVVLAIVLAFGVPSFRNLVVSNTLSSQVNGLSGDIAAARSAATLSPDAVVTVCASANGTSCRDSQAWEGGWISFRDENGDGAVDAGDEILRVSEALNGGNTLRVKGFSGGGKLFQFDGKGMPANPGTLIVCDDRGASEAAAISVSGAGQVRLVRDGKDHTGTALSCP